MAEKEKEEIAEEKVAEKKTRPLLKWIVILVVALIVVASGIFGWMYLANKRSVEVAVTGRQLPSIGAVWRMDPFIVNIIGDNNRAEKYLKVVIQLELSDQGVIPELELLKPKLRDSILDLLAEKKYEDLANHKGRQRFRDEIAIRVNSFLTGGKVVRVYFTEFIIQ